MVGHALESKGLCTVQKEGRLLGSGSMGTCCLHHLIDMKWWWKLGDIVIWIFSYLVASRAGDCSISTLFCKTRKTWIQAVDMITGQLLWFIEDIQTQRAGYLLLEFI